jgi:hypothetical protein
LLRPSSLQEFLAAREVVKRLAESAFDTDKVLEIFGAPSEEGATGDKTEGATKATTAAQAFTDPRWQVVLPMCADLLTTENDTGQVATFAAALFGGRVDARRVSVAKRAPATRARKTSTALECVVDGCRQTHVSG